MLPERWLLILNVLALSSSWVYADEATDHAFAKAMLCSTDASTVYAEFTRETAQVIASIAIRKCIKLWASYDEAQIPGNIIFLERALGRKLNEDEQKKANSFYPDHSIEIDELEMEIMDWRAQEKRGDIHVYEKARQEFRMRYSDSLSND